MFEIYSSNATLIAEAFKGSAMLMADSEYRYFLLSGFIMGIIVMLYMSILGKGGDSTSNVRMVTMSVVIIMAFFTPKTDVLIVDRFTDEHVTVSNVPLGVGITGYLTSAVGHYLSTGYTTVFSGVGGANGGFLSSVYIIDFLRDIQLIGTYNDSTDQTVRRIDLNINNYLLKCYFNDYFASDEPKYGGWLFDASKTPIDTIADNDQGIYTRFIDPSSGAKTTVTCSDFYSKVKSMVNSADFKKSLRVALYRKYSNLSNAKTAFPKDMKPDSQQFKDWLNDKIAFLFNGGALVNQTFGVQTSSPQNIGIDIDSILRDSYLSNKIRYQNRDFYLKALKDNPLYHAYRDSLNQRYLQFAAESNQFQEMAIPVMMFVEMLVFSLTPFIGFMIAIGIGLKVVSMYIKMLIWIQLWPVSLAIANFYISENFASKLGELTGTAITMGSLDRVFMEAKTFIGTGSMWISMVPIVTLFILSGSMYVFTQMAQRMQGADTFNEKRVAPDQIDAAPNVAVQSMSSGLNQGPGGLSGASRNQQSAAFDAKIGGGYQTAASNARQSSIQANEAWTENKNRAVNRAFEDGNISTTSLGLSNKDSSSTAKQFSLAYQYAHSNATNETFQKMTQDQWNTAFKAMGMGEAGAGMVGKLSAKAGIEDAASRAESLGYNKSDMKSLLNSMATNTGLQKGFAETLEYTQTDKNDAAVKEALGDSEGSSFLKSHSVMQSAQEVDQATKAMSQEYSVGRSGNLFEMANSLARTLPEGADFNGLLSKYSSLNDGNGHNIFEQTRSQVDFAYDNVTGLTTGNSMIDNKPGLARDIMTIVAMGSTNQDLAPMIAKDFGFSSYSDSEIKAPTGVPDSENLKSRVNSAVSGVPSVDEGDGVRAKVKDKSADVSGKILSGKEKLAKAESLMDTMYQAAGEKYQDSAEDSEGKVSKSNLHNALLHNAIVDGIAGYVGDSKELDDYRNAAEAMSANPGDADAKMEFLRASGALGQAAVGKLSGEAEDKIVSAAGFNNSQKTDYDTYKNSASDAFDKGDYIQGFADLTRATNMLSMSLNSNIAEGLWDNKSMYDNVLVGISLNPLVQFSQTAVAMSSLKSDMVDLYTNDAKTNPHSSPYANMNESQLEARADKFASGWLESYQAARDDNLGESVASNSSQFKVLSEDYKLMAEHLRPLDYSGDVTTDLGVGLLKLGSFTESSTMKVDDDMNNYMIEPIKEAVAYTRTSQKMDPSDDLFDEYKARALKDVKPIETSINANQSVKNKK